MMSACDSQVTGSLTAAVLNEKVCTVANQKLHTPEEVKALGRQCALLRYIFDPLKMVCIKLIRNSARKKDIGNSDSFCCLNR